MRIRLVQLILAIPERLDDKYIVGMIEDAISESEVLNAIRVVTGTCKTVKIVAPDEGGS